MKKIAKKFKKIIAAIGTFFVSIWTKVLATTYSRDLPPVQSEYGVETEKVAIPLGIRILRFITNICVPIIIIIGTIIYLKKSKSSKGKKIVVILIALAIVFILIPLLQYVYYWLYE